jgi:zinc/manganese transport system substrate-binding protein
MLFAVAMLSLLSLSAPDFAADRIPVVTSFSILGDLAGVVGGERVAVSTLVGPDADAHIFQPSPNDVKAITRARLVVVNGLGFEGWLERLMGAASYKGETVVASKSIKPRQMPDEDNPATQQIDPHAWQDPVNVIVYVRNITAALSKLDPAGAAYYQQNAEQYLQSLRQLDTWAAEHLAQIAPARREVITSHDAFGYLGARYGIRFIAPQGISTESEASARDMARLLRQIKRDRIKAVYIENMTNPMLLEQLSREARITIGAKLYSDALSGPQGPASTYLKMMRYNIEQLMAGLKQN